MSSRSVEVYKRKRSPGERFLSAAGSTGLLSAAMTGAINLPNGVGRAAKAGAIMFPIATGLGYFIEPKYETILKDAQYTPIKDPTSNINRLVGTPLQPPKKPMQQLMQFFNKTPDVVSGGKFFKFL